MLAAVMSSSASASSLEHGRRACARRQWRAGYELLAASDTRERLAAGDLWLLALAAYLVGEDAAFRSALERAHRRHLDAGELPQAVRCAFWIGLHLADRAEAAQASGWFSRAARILDRVGGEIVEHGYLLVAEGMRRFAAGDLDVAREAGERAARLADRYDDPDLRALSIHLQGRALVRDTRVAEGLALLDEAMVAVGTDTLSPIVTGLVYCSVIGACRSVHAFGRARQWTEALNEWCERQPDLVTYTGECRVYRSELMHFRGAWREALDEACRAEESARAGGSRSAVALALYQKGEAYRLLGEFAAAEAAFRAASRAGHEPQPGLALLRLAQGDVEAASAGIRRTLAEAADRVRRARLLPAHVEIMLAAGDFEAATGSCTELRQLAHEFDSDVLRAMAEQACGQLEIETGRPESALSHLRAATRVWQALDGRFHAARTRGLLGLACAAIGDRDAANLELEAARAEFEMLGATREVGGIDRLLAESAVRRHPHGLTDREVEVLTEVATGKTNRQIAVALFISERTVARHLSNIFRKLGISSRAAATAYAFERGLRPPPA